MIHFQHIPRSSYRRSAWKNGLGHTDEIEIHPPGSDLRRGDFLWRLSSARIAQASPFSVFPDHDRILVVLKGAGVRLFHRFDDENSEEERVELTALNAYEFPGDIQSRCELTDGEITDFSVFIRKAEAEASVETIHLTRDEPHAWLPAGRWNFLFAAQGGFQAKTSSGLFQIQNGDCLRVEPTGALSEDESIELFSQDDAVSILAVSISA